MLMNTLDRYIGKSILGAIFATLFTLVGLSAIIKFVEQFRSVGKVLMIFGKPWLIQD